MNERVAPTVEQLCGIIYDALKDQFPSEGAAIIIASCCAEPIHRRLAAALAACAREARLAALEEARQLCIAEKEEWRKMDRWLPADAADNCEIHIRALIEETKAAALERAVGEKGKA